MKKIFLLLFVLTIPVSCASFKPVSQEEMFKMDLMEVSNKISESLEQQKDQFNSDKTRIISTTFVNIEDLYITSTFGRYCSQQLSDELLKKGIEVVEVRKLNKVVVERRLGEFGLSRESKEIAQKYRANTIMFGLYTVTPNAVLLNVRLVDAETSKVVAAATKIFDRKENSLVNYLVAHGSNVHNRGAVEVSISGFNDDPIRLVSDLKN